MAYSFGGGIRPELGRTDYSGYLQGALQGARSNAAGSAAIGQGIANLGETAGKAVKEYYVKKEEKQQFNDATDWVVDTAANNPEIAKILNLPLVNDPNADPKDIRKAASVAVRAVGVPAVLNLRMQLEGKEEDKKLATETARVTRILEGYGSMDEGDTPADPRAVQAGQNQFLQNQLLRSQAADNFAQARARGAPAALSDKDVLYRDLMAKAIADNGGNPLTPDQRAKISEQAYGSRPPKYVLTVDEQLKLDSQKLENAETIKRSAAFLNDVSSNAIEASQNLNDIRETRRLLSLPNTNTGWGQEAITALRSFAARLGMDDAGLAEQEALQAYINVDALRQTQALMSKQGSITENERKLVDRTSQTASKNPKALGELLDLREAVAKRSNGAEMERQRLFDEGKSMAQIAEGVRRWYQKNTVSKMLDGIKGLRTSSIVRDANNAMGEGL